MSAVLNTATCGPAAWCRAEQVHENKDSATGEVEYFTTPRRPGLDSGSFFSERYVFVSFHTFMPQVSASLPYLLEVITYTPNWVEIDAGTSLTLTLDQIEQLPAEEYFRLEWKLAVDRSHLFMLKTSSAPIAPDRLKEPFHAW